MKIRVLTRLDQEYLPETKWDIPKKTRSIKQERHPFQRAREYTRSLNATKLDRIFAKPFVCAFDGHQDSIWRIATSPKMLTLVVSGSCDGEICCWNLTSRNRTWKIKAHQGFVRGLCVESSGKHVLSCGDDKIIRIWNLHSDRQNNVMNMNNYNKEHIKSVASFLSKSRLTDLTCSFDTKSLCFATSGAQVDLWFETRSSPIHSFSWSSETVRGVRFNPVEKNILCSWSSDRKLVLYDTRIKSATNCVTLKNQINDIAWNPREAFSLTLGTADYNAYTFDIRSLKKAKKIHLGHVQAIESVAYSSTGREFVTGGYDSTVRIFEVNKGKNREIYHTKRMHRVHAVCFSADSRFVISGSDDANVRVWKSNSSRPFNKLKPPEESKLNYYEQLKIRFEHLPEIRKISKHRHLPRWLKNKSAEQHLQRVKMRRKKENYKKNNKENKAMKKEIIVNARF